MSENPSVFTKLLRPFCVNDVETGQSDWYPELTPRRYRVPIEEVREAVCEVVEGRTRWRLDEVDEGENRIEAEVETAVFGFIDDVTVNLERDEGTTVVRVRSRSRVGEADFGKNAETIRELFERLDARLAGEDDATEA